jgi:hypothetical protein
MSFEDCIRNAVTSGRIRQDKGDEALRAYQAEFQRQRGLGMTDAEADAAAGLHSVERLTKEKKLVRQRRMLEMRRAWEIQSEIDKVAPSKLPSFIERFMDEKVQARYDTRLGQYHAIIESVLQKYKPRFAGLIRTARGVDNIVREMFGTGTGDANARLMAAALKEAMETSARFANRSGANIDFDPTTPYIPQMHSRQKMMKKKDQWVADHMNWLDWDKMKHFNDGQPILPENRAAVLDYVYDTLISDGYVRVKPGQRGARSITEKLSHKRFLHYKNADSWLAANKAYGDGNAISQFVAHLDSMARDTAVIDVFGPNPDNLRVYLGNAAKQKAGQESASKQTTKAVSKIQDSINKLDEAYRVFMGANAASQDNFFATAMQTTRNVITSAFLGSTAPLAFFGDLAKAMHRGQWEKTSPGKFLNFYAKNVVSNMTRREAVRAGLLADNAVSLAMGQVRFTGDFGGAKWSQYLADVALRGTFLSPHTQVAKWAAGMELMGAMADNAGKAFDRLPFRDLLERNGITAADWDVFRSTAVHDPRGLHILRPDDLRARTDIDERTAFETADRFMDLIHRERKRRVIESSLRAQVTLRSDAKAGTLPGEALRSLSQLKSFPFTIGFQILEDFADRQGTVAGAAYVSTMMLSLTFAGALGMQVQQVASGRDPLDMTTPEFWGASMLKGGGLGILGDFLFSNVNRYGQGLSSIAAGPAVGFWNDLRNLTVGNLAEMAEGKDTKFFKEAVDFGGRYTPGSNGWWYKLFFRRMFLDQLMKDADPKAMQRFRQQERNALKNYGQKFWWSPGDSSPDRAPDVGAVLP